MRLKAIFYKTINAVGLTTISNLNEQIADKHKKLKEARAKNVEYSSEAGNLRRVLREIEESLMDESRSKLVQYVGKEVEAKARYITHCKFGKRGVLVADVKIGGELVAKHLWLRDYTTKAEFKKYRTVYIYGTVQKYGSLTYQKNLKESYTIHEPSINHTKKKENK